MKPNPKMLFGNIFEDERITPNYLARFTDDVIARLIQNNTGNAFDAVLLPLQNKIIPLRSELGQVDTTLNTQVGKTATVDSFMADFIKYMKDKYMNIAVALGGDKTPAFKEFYPHGKTEYNTITKNKMPLVMNRLNTVAVTYQTQLGTTISGELQALQNDWTELRNSQLQQKSTVATNRSDRTTARKNVEIELLKTIHFIGNKFPGDIVVCKTFFDFNLLFGARHKSLEDTPEVA